MQEVSRIKAEHVDDPQAILNDRVKGQLKVTRAFGAGFLKKVSSIQIYILTVYTNYSFWGIGGGFRVLNSDDNYKHVLINWI